MFTFSTSPIGVPVVSFVHDLTTMLGGAGAVKTSDLFTHVEGVADVFPFDISLHEFCIITNPACFALLSKEEQTAMLLHEEGHIILGHLKNPELLAAAARGKPVVLEWMEKEADAYAAQRMGKKVVSSALRTISGQFMLSPMYTRILGIVGAFEPDDRENFREYISELIAPRLAALK